MGTNPETPASKLLLHFGVQKPFWKLRPEEGQNPKKGL